MDVPLNIEATDNFAGNKIRQIRIAPTETLLTSDRQNRAANNPSDAIHNISLAVLRGKVNPARQENGLLFSKAETVRGTYNPERRLIELFADRKPETVLHEVSHYFFQNYFAVADKYGYSDYDRGMLRWLSKQGKHEIKSLNDMETQDWENLTETFLRYLNTGNAPTIATRGVFQKAKEWVLDVFEINRDIASNEVKDFFDSLVAREGKMPNIDELLLEETDI